MEVEYAKDEILILKPHVDESVEDEYTEDGYTEDGYTEDDYTEDEYTEDESLEFEYAGVSDSESEHLFTSSCADDSDYSGYDESSY